MAGSSWYRGPDADEAWRLISTAFNTVSDDLAPEDRGAYWLDVQAGTALLLAALHILAEELQHHGPSFADDDSTPLTVKLILKMIKERRDSIRAAVLDHLLWMS